MNKPWHRQPEESTKAFYAFMLYRDILPRERSLQKVCQKCAKSIPYLSHLKRWSSRHHWVVRAQAYDDHLAAVRVESQEQAIIDMAERQAKEGMAMQAKGIEKMRDTSSDQMSARDAIHAIDVGAKLERTARGEPTEIVKGKHTIKAAKELTDDELARIIQEEGEEEE